MWVVGGERYSVVGSRKTQGSKLWVVEGWPKECGLGRKIFLPTDFHGLARIFGLRAQGYFFLLLSHRAVWLSSQKMKSAVPAY